MSQYDDGVARSSARDHMSLKCADSKYLATFRDLCAHADSVPD
jgi:hypothetical protein